MSAEETSWDDARQVILSRVMSQLEEGFWTSQGNGMAEDGTLFEYQYEERDEDSSRM